MAYIRGSPPQEPRSSEEASEEETESDEALARRLQAEEQGRPVARFELLDHVEARYKDPELRGGTWSRDYYAATVVDVLPPKTQKRPHSYMLRWDDGSEDQLVLEDYIRPAPEAPAAEPRERDGKRGLANGFRTEAPPPKKRGRPSKKGGRPPKAAAAPAPAPESAPPSPPRAGPATATDDEEAPWTPEEEQHLQELVDEHGEGDWSWPTIAEELGTGRTKEAVEEHYNNMLERRRIPAAAAAGDDEAQKLRINASGRIATLVQKKQRGWLVVKLDENEGEDGAPHEQRSIRTNFVTLLDAAGNDVVPTKKKRRRPTAAPGAAPAPAPAPRKRRPKDFAEGDRVTVLESADSHGGRSGAIVEKNTAWWRVKLDGDDEATSIRGKDLRAAATPAPGAPVPAPAPAAAAPPPPPPPAAARPPAAVSPPPPPPAAAPPPAGAPIDGLPAAQPGVPPAAPPAFAPAIPVRPGPVPLVIASPGAPAPAPDAATAALAELSALAASPAPPSAAASPRAGVPAPPPAPPPQPGFFLTNTSASLVQWFRLRFPGSAEAGDKFEGLVNRWAMLPEDLLNMDVEDCKRMLREEGFETAVVGMLQMRLRSACRAWMQPRPGAAPAMPGAR